MLKLYTKIFTSRSWKYKNKYSSYCTIKKMVLLLHDIQKSISDDKEIKEVFPGNL